MALVKSNTVEADDFCTYDESGELFTTCINPDHIEQWRECARISDFELNLRLADLGNTLDLVLRQLNGWVAHLPEDKPRLKARFVRQYLSLASQYVGLSKIAMGSRR